ncbi:LysR family transcriptional regulator [Gordonia hongkongensis]|uniref:LysR family transcriptional regulator n=1 Tax=Gordonia hongkongensis TaxID=1701090 RepID=A0AAX3T5G5_9ACTN|nr:LysR family transcriptional regulator [Gordonia hongkongensis]QIK46610.1 LysR family transcriptional regulator [Gordonia terrae]WFP24390.1 LysR family transcriptional regulator [Gordonia hongkongensis]
MELRHLRYFAAVADTCHFGQAAESLHVAQPALSYAIRQLEAELDVTLFTRTTRQVSLTPAGQYLRAQAERILAGVDEAVDGVRRIAAGRSGLVRVGITGIAAFSHLPRIARVVKRELPDVDLRIQSDMLTPGQCDALRAGTLDLGILRPPAIGEHIDTTVIDVEPMVLAVSVDHRLAAEPVVSVADLRHEPFVLYDSRDSAVNDAAIRTCRAAGFVPHRVHQAPGTAVLLALVAAGLGVALLPASVRSLPLDGLVVRDLVDADTVEVALAWRSGSDDPVVTAVADVIAAAFADSAFADSAAESRDTQLADHRSVRTRLGARSGEKP